MRRMLLATTNPHKQKQLSNIVKNYFKPEIKKNLKEIQEEGDNFLSIAQSKAINYSRKYNCLAISTDGGAVIPALNQNEWNPVKTKRFAHTDQERIDKLLDLMKHKTDRTVKWYEALAVADTGELLFSDQAEAMEGVLDTEFNPKFYREGMWLCSLTSFPQFNDKNFFQLNEPEKQATENSWTKLQEKFKHFAEKNRTN